MRRLLPLLLVVLAGCHRVTGLDGGAGEARHGNGYHYLTLGTFWLSLFAVVAGVGFVVHGRLVRRRHGGSDGLLWGSTLLVIGVVLFVGTFFSGIGLWVCHGDC